MNSFQAIVAREPGPASLCELSDADLPEGDRPAPYLPPARLAAARSAVRAWEAASGWRAEPSYARLQLARLRSDAAGQADGTRRVACVAPDRECAAARAEAGRREYQSHRAF